MTGVFGEGAGASVVVCGSPVAELFILPFESSCWYRGAVTYAKMKLSLAILVVCSAVALAAPIISTANKVAVNFYMESL